MVSRKTTSAPVRIYSYGCRVESGHETVRAELRSAHEFYNQLIEIERARRESFRAARRSVCPELDALESRLGALASELKWLHDAKRGGDDTAVDEIRRLKAERKDVGARAKAERERFSALLAPAQKTYGELRACDGGPHSKARANSEALATMLDGDWPAPWKEIARADALAVEQTKRARAERGCCAATGGLVEKAIEAARRSKADPRFARWRGEGRVGGQVMGGIDTTKLFAGGSIISIQLGERMNRRSRAARATLRLGEDGDGNARLVTLSLSWHRELPSDARVTYAWLLARKLGPRTTYELQLTLEATDLPRRSFAAPSEGTVDVRLGWSAVRAPDGSVQALRVASYESDDGSAGECLLPGSVVERLNHRENALRGIADRHYAAAHSTFVRHVRIWSARSPGLVPAWLTTRPEPLRGRVRKAYIETMRDWRSHETLARVARRWLEETVSRDDVTRLWSAWRAHRDALQLDYFGSRRHIDVWLRERGLDDSRTRLLLYLEWWRRKDTHLAEWGANQTSRAIGRRRQIYRDWAIALSRRYARLVLHDIDLRTTARDKTPPDKAPNPVHSMVRSQQRDAAPSDLRAALLEVFGPERAKCERSSDASTTGGARVADPAENPASDAPDGVAPGLSAAE